MRRKTLYLSDLDGTLLMPDASLSPFSRQCLNELIRQGLSFSCATARTAASAVPILDGLFLPLPVILLNGSCLFDLRTKRYEAVHYLHADAFAALLSLCRESGIHGFFHTIENDTLCTYYTKTDTPIAAAYMQDRIKRYHKRFIPLSDPAEIPNTHAVVYFTYTNSAQKLDPLLPRIQALPHLRYEYYEDVYHPGFQYLEIFDASASKYSASRYLHSVITKMTCRSLQQLIIRSLLKTLCRHCKHVRMNSVLPIRKTVSAAGCWRMLSVRPLQKPVQRRSEPDGKTVFQIRCNGKL